MSTAKRQKADPAKIRKVVMKRIQEIKEMYQAYKADLNDADKTIEPLEEELQLKLQKIRDEHFTTYEDKYAVRAEASEKFVEINHELRERMVDHYVKTGEKVIDENLSVRENVKLVYENDAAVKWAESNAPIMIVKSVDKKAFESLPTVADLDFVDKEITPVSVIKGI